MCVPDSSQVRLRVFAQLHTVSKDLKSPASRSVIAPRPVFSLSEAKTHVDGTARTKPAFLASVFSTTGDDAPAGVMTCDVAVGSAAAPLGRAKEAATPTAERMSPLLLLFPESREADSTLSTLRPADDVVT